MSSGEPSQCSFCGKAQGEHVHLLTANGLSICNYCVAFAHQVFTAECHLPVEPEDPGFRDDDAEDIEDTLTRPKGFLRNR